MSRLGWTAGLTALALTACASTASAHFVWLVPDAAGGVQVHFSESGDAGDAELLGRVSMSSVWRITAGGVEEIALDAADGRLGASFGGEMESVVRGEVDYGLLTRDDKTFLLRYRPKTYVGAATGVASHEQSSAESLDLVPHIDGGTVACTVTWDGAALEGVDVTLLDAAGRAHEGTTDASGRFVCTPTEPGRCAVRVRHVTQESGEHDGQAYDEVRTYSTVTFEMPRSDYPELPFGLTSFGAATCDGSVYIYGGHRGRPHSYFVEDQSDAFLRLDLADPSKGWVELEGGPRLQGLAMVTHGGKLYRLGGFTALAKRGEESKQKSQDSFACYDPATATWTELPPMPEPRSSFDAMVWGDHLYVVGGWAMTDEGTSRWSETAYAVDLRQSPPTWRALAEPPFRRRALSLATLDGKLYCVGGMREEGGPTGEVSIYDMATDTWSDGPALPPSGSMKGFGSSSFAWAGSVYTTLFDGSFLRLVGDEWVEMDVLPDDRFFHRLLPLDAQHMVVIAGANMESGSYRDLLVLPVPTLVDGSGG